MRILILSTHDIRGGAAIVAYRLAKDFESKGHEVCLYVQDKKSQDDFVVKSKADNLVSRVRKIADYFPGYFLNLFNRDTPFTLGMFGGNINKVIKEFKPDVINVHWTWKGFVSFNQICIIAETIPVFWTMHDYSPFSGGYFYPMLRRNSSLDILAKVNNILRLRSIRKSKIQFISPSEFLKAEFLRSPFKNNSIITINNGLDLSGRLSSDDVGIKLREAHGLNLKKKYIVFGAVNMLNNEVKGWNMLSRILVELQSFLLDKNIGILSFGNENPFENIILDSRIETKYLGYLSNQEALEVIALADIFLLPSRFENYPLVALESISVGTPVVAFDVGGIKEIISSSDYGLLAKPYVISDFVENVEKILSFGKIKSSQVMDRFSIVKKGDEYLELFNNYLKTRRS